MTYLPDLAETGPVKPVGFLSREHDYTRGDISEAVFDRLASLSLRPLLEWLGTHQCDLGSCGTTELQSELYWRGMKIPDYCWSDILVPDKTVVYIAPALILHYIRVHQYLPPACFVDAVLNCPEPGSEEYRATIRKIAPDFAAGLD